MPIAVFGPAFATYAWLGISIAALLAAWWLGAPGSGSLRWLWLLGAVAWYPVLYSLSLAQPDLVAVLAVVAAWRLAEARRPFLAGIVLAASALKPQLLLAVPLVLLAAGRWRIAVAWAAAVAALAAISLALIGGAGLADYRSLLAEAQHVTNNRYFTLAYVLGPGIASYAAQLVVAAAGAAAAYVGRRESLDRLFALGILTTALGATYWHLQDFTLLVPAAWLFWRGSPPAWQRLWLLAVVVAGEFAWPLTPLPILVGVAVWFGCTAWPRSSPKSEPAPA